MKTVKSIKGSQGLWEVEVTYTDGTAETLPCVHQYFWQARPAPHYDDRFGDGDGGIGDTNKFQKHIAMIREKGRVVLTTDTTDESKGRGKGFFQRTGYVGVYSISDFTLDGTRIRFNFVERFPSVMRT